MATATITFTDTDDGEVKVSANFGEHGAKPQDSDAHAMVLELLGLATKQGEVTSVTATRVGEG